MGLDPSPPPLMCTSERGLNSAEHGSFMYVTRRIHMHVTCLIRMYVTWRIHMGWLRLVASIKLYVYFAKEPYKKDHILQKWPIIVSILLTVATPYVIHGVLKRGSPLWTCFYQNMFHHVLPLVEEIRIQIFRSPDYTGFLHNQRSDGDSCLLTWKLVWNRGNSRENLFGFPAKTCLEFWQS